MSVYHQTLVLYGWEIGKDTYRNYDTESWENELEQEYGWRDRSEGEVACVYDGRGGEYCYFGVVVAATNDTGAGPQRFDSPVEIDPLGGVISAESARKLGEVVGELGLDVDSEPKYHIFTHIT
jgi:hypothetical protein